MYMTLQTLENFMPFLIIIFNLNLKDIFQRVLIVSTGEHESYYILVVLEN